MSRAPHALLAVSLTVACAHANAAPTAPETEPTPRVTTAAERGSFTGGEDWFTGTATVAMLFSPNGPRDFGGASVAFEPGARTAWHAHPAGQTLVVTEGHGWVQLEGEARRDIRTGDVVWTPPGVRHWHGATATTAMTHLALQGAVDGAVVDWQEHVTDAQYLGEAAE